MNIFFLLTKIIGPNSIFFPDISIETDFISLDDVHVMTDDCTKKLVIDVVSPNITDSSEHENEEHIIDHVSLDHVDLNVQDINESLYDDNTISLPRKSSRNVKTPS